MFPLLPLSEVGKEAMKTHRYLPSPKPFAEKKKGSGKELLMVGGALMEVPIEKERERGKRAINLAMASRFWVRRDSKVLLMLGIACKTRVSSLDLPITFFTHSHFYKKIYLLENTGNASPPTPLQIEDVPTLSRFHILSLVGPPPSLKLSNQQFVFLLCHSGNPHRRSSEK